MTGGRNTGGVTEEEARHRFTAAAVARLATVDAGGRPHLVPIVFAVDGDTVYTAVDHKPKRGTTLRRVTNLRANPSAALLVDHYDDDWTALWWVRADGAGRVLDPDDDEARHARSLLAKRYRQYAVQQPAGPVIAIDVTRWSGWSATATG